ncbi:MAG TPA: pyridoxamine 5'-phosphate oxidase family protein, partial [Methanomicrobiales archaeon]|nr:pyridoxamine 5'-phosphate oxidase family protein [Methanomicrobiales archaeon]
RATPIEYSWEGGSLYFLSEGGEKFAHIRINPRVSVAIYDEYRGMERLAGMQIQGTASLISPSDPQYEKTLKPRGLTPGQVTKFGFPLHLIRVQMEKIEFLNSHFQAQGYDARQVVEGEELADILRSAHGPDSL